METGSGIHTCKDYFLFMWNKQFLSLGEENMTRVVTTVFGGGGGGKEVSIKENGVRE